jgi:hypothetical protein
MLENRCLRYERLLRALSRYKKLPVSSSDEGQLTQGEVDALEAWMDLPEWQDDASPEGEHVSSTTQDKANGASPDKEQLESMIDGIGEMQVDAQGRNEYRGDSSGTRFTRSICTQVLDDSTIATSDIFDHGESMELHLQKRSDSHHREIKQSTDEQHIDDLDDANEDLAAEIPQEVDLPPREIAERLTELCFEHALAALQFFHAPSFRKDMASLFDKHEEGKDIDEEPFLPVLFAALAVGCIFSSAIKDELGLEDPKLRAFQYFQASKRRSDPLSRATYHVLQTLLCQSLFLQSTANMSVCWVHLGLAMKCAQRMGIQRDMGNNFPLAEAQLRRKIFWIIRNLDLYLHAVLGLPRGIEPADHDQAPVVALDDEFLLDDGTGVQPDELPSTYLAANETTKLMTILGRIVRQVYPLGRDQGRTMVPQHALASLEQELHAWHDALPKYLRDPDEATRLGMIHWRLTSLIHYAYHHTQFLLYRPFLHYIADSNRSQHQAYAVRCKDAAFAILELTKQVLDREPQLFGHILTLYATFFAGLILFYCVIQAGADMVSSDREACLEQADIAIRAMEICSGCSYAAERCLDILQQMKKQVSVAPVKKESESGSGSSSNSSKATRRQSQSSLSQAPETNGSSRSRSSDSARAIAPIRRTSTSTGRANRMNLSLRGSMPGPDPAFNKPDEHNATATSRPAMPSRLNPSFSSFTKQPEHAPALSQQSHAARSQAAPGFSQYDTGHYTDLDYTLGRQSMHLMGTPQTFDFDGVSDTYQPNPSMQAQSLGPEAWMADGAQFVGLGQDWMQYGAQPSQHDPHSQNEQMQEGDEHQAWSGQGWPQQGYSDAPGNYMYQQ